MKKLLLFQIGNKLFGMDLPLVKNIYKEADIVIEDRKQENSSHLIQSHQMVSVDGKKIPLYDLSLIPSFSIGMRDKESSLSRLSEGKKVMLIHVQNRFLALGVERVVQVVSVEDNRIVPLPPIFGKPALLYFPQVLKYHDRLVLLLEPEELKEDEPKSVDRDKETVSEDAETIASDLFSLSNLSGQKSEDISPPDISQSDETAEDEPHTASYPGICIPFSDDLEELENLLTNKVKEENISAMITQYFILWAERTVSQEIKKIKRVLSVGC